MAKVNFSMQQVTKQIGFVVKKDTPTIIGEISLNMARGVIKENFIPILHERLATSAFTFSNFDQGIIRWVTPYAEKRYYDNISGIEKWDNNYYDKYYKDFEKYYKKRIEQELSKYL